MDDNSNPDSEDDMSHRHTPHQIRMLEEHFKQLPNPDANQRSDIARQLRLDLSQVTSWFHDKRNKRTDLDPPAENNARRTENMCGDVQAFPALPEKENLSNEVTSSSVGQTNIALMNPQNLIAASGSTSEMEKEVMKKKSERAFNELSLLCSESKLWNKSNSSGYVLCREAYLRRFPGSRLLQTTGFRFESSKDSTEVSLKASNLAKMFLDMDQWTDLFPTIVREAQILESVDIERRRALHLIYGRMHILSPLVAPRNFIFLRRWEQTSPYSWLILDQSYYWNRAASHTLPWKYPSGVKIEHLSDTISKVTWVEHVKVNESNDQPLYRDLLSNTSHGYGATRWLSTLRRMSERSLYSRSSHVHEEGIVILKAREHFMTFSLGMIRNFCSVLSMPWNSSGGSTNLEVKISVRNNNETGQYPGKIVSASASIRLPLTVENLFNFLTDENRRPEWDVMNNRILARNIIQFSTGPHQGDSISVLQERGMYLLQESSMDPTVALVIFSPVSVKDIGEIETGKRNIPILPSGFLISSDGCPDENGISDGASTSTGTTSSPSGSLLTLLFQGLESTEKAVDTITSIINDITVALDCP